jgi:trimeric autotransporter adhesin
MPLALMGLALLATASAGHIKVTQSSFDNVPVYSGASLGYTDVSLDVANSFGIGRKKDKTWGVKGWEVEPIVTTNAVAIAPDGYNVVKVRAASQSASKFAPSKAYATAYGENAGTGDVYVVAFTRANGKPGAMFGVQSTVSDGTAISAGPVDGAGNAVVITSSRATGGWGVTTAKSYGYAESNVGAYVGEDTRANSAKWYASPGVAIAGGGAYGRGGHVRLEQRVRARADLGLAVAGSINIAKSNGIQPVYYDVPDASATRDFGGANVIYETTEVRPRIDVGMSIGGAINIASSENGKVVALVDNVDAGAAVGDAASGSLTVAVSNQNDVLIGDYDISDATQNEVIARVRGRGYAQGGQVNIGLAPNGDSSITGNVVVAADQGDALAAGLTLSNAWGAASNDMSVTSSTSEYVSVAALVGLSQAQEQAVNTLAASARSNIGSVLSYALANSIIGEIDVATSSSSATTVTGQAASTANSQSLGGITTESQAASTATTKDGHALSAASAISASAVTAEAVSTSSATTTSGAALSGSAALAIAADAEADSASSAASAAGNIGSASVSGAFGLLEGKANSASSGATEIGSVGSLSVSASTGGIQAQSKVSSSAQTSDGNAESLAGAYAFAGVNAVASSKSTAASQTGDVDATAEAFGIGGFHGEANADAAAATGCPDCDSTAYAWGLATGAIADATARAKADSPKNPGQAIGNAMALGGVARTSNGGLARVAIGPAQALTGGFAVSAPRSTVNEVNKAVAKSADPAKKAAMKEAIKTAVSSQLPKPVSAARTA